MSGNGMGNKPDWDSCLSVLQDKKVVQDKKPTYENAKNTNVSSVYDEDKWGKYYKIYAHLPKIGAIIIAVMMFIWGIIDARMVTVSYDSEFNIVRKYGVLALSGGFLCWFVWMLIGAALALMCYFLGNIAISYRVMHVIYMRKLLDTENAIAAVETKAAAEAKKEVKKS